MLSRIDFSLAILISDVAPWGNELPTPALYFYTQPIHPIIHPFSSADSNMNKSFILSEETWDVTKRKH